MKRFSLIIGALALTLGAMAQPILVGHRGSLYGVESSVEALEAGAKLGYQYLESDLKVTKDLKFVLSHDDDLTRLGGTKAIATSTLEELQSETLTQTRSSVTYTGRVASLEEMLAICDQYNCRPLIELKWATGINNNDCSNIPALVSFLEEKGYRNKCIILTSMKPCLEYIRTNYPDITLQFLTGQYWANHFDWCVQWRIDADIQAGYFDKSTVRKYHAEGLLVNMWTTNTESGYKTYGNMGCDFITTDYLDPASLPELDAEVTFPPNYTDYPEMEASVKGKYDVELRSTAAYAPADGYTIRDAVCDGSKWYVLSHNAAGEPRLEAVSTADGAVEVYSLEGLQPAMLTLSAIALTADGTLVGCNKDKVAYNEGEAGTWRLYKLTAAGAEELLALNYSTPLGNWVNGIVGDRLAVSGRDFDLKAYTCSYSASAATPTYRISGVYLDKGVFAASNYSVDGSFTADRLGDFRMMVTTSSRDNLMFYSSKLAPVEYNFNWEADRVPLDEYSVIDAEPQSYLSGAGLAMMRYGTKPYLVMPLADNDKLSPVVYDYTDRLEQMQPVTLPTADGLATDEFCATAVRILLANSVQLHMLTSKGLAVWAFDPAGEEEEVRDLGLVLERQWINSNTTDNRPDHIDGTNAQQGTAWNGLFYVNDCSDKLIYIFDETGCIGSVPGGAGWGCCRDDVGNICVRDDKLTGTTHKFIIYPAGLRPDSDATPVEIEVEVPLEGQTNFINASGDLLGAGGHIYLYSNKQSKVSILTIVNGAMTGSKTSGDLRMEATTAGYVIPIDDDVENWLYQVRSTGFYQYNGGESLDCLTTRASTSAPARNSTGGGCYIKIGANRVLLHNCGANYKGGFAVRDLTIDKVYTYIEPIGNLGYESGGNYSTFNWLFAEQRGEADYTIYQYCASNGMAVYRLYDPNLTRVDEMFASEAAQGLGVNVAAGNITVTMPDGSAAAMVCVYGADGRLVARCEGNVVDASALPHGVYVVSAAGLAAKVSL